MNPSLTNEELAALGRIDACSLANAIESFHARLRNEGFADSSVRCIFPKLRPMVGYAATVKIRGASPPMGSATYSDQTDWWDYVLSVPAPRVLVVQDVSSTKSLGALLGEVHVNILRALGCVGAVTDGAVRDLPAIEELRFPLFAANPAVSHSYVHIVEVGTPVKIGGLGIASGDLVHGDLHGIQTIPLDLAPKIPAVAAAMSAREQAIIAECRSPHLKIEQLRAIMAKPRT
jgi:4-hydroxy-4-methyl-2-oxoglutarate aldolase